MRTTSAYYAVAGLTLMMSICDRDVRGAEPQDFSLVAAKQQVATCVEVTALDACHPHYPTGCSASKKPKYDAYLNFLKDQDPSPSSVPTKTLTEHDWAEKETLLADIDLTKTNHAASAKELAALDEGKIVAVVGYLYYRVTNRGETSNCQLTGPENNDFHLGVGFDRSIAVQLASGKDVPQAQSSSVIVEMTPQFRAAHHPKWTQQTVDALIGHQIEAVGQLIVDNEHMSGKDDCGVADAEPTCWRRSVWELHPVTQFYYCPSDACAAGSSDWVPLDKGVEFTTGSPASKIAGEATARIIAKPEDGSRVTILPTAGGEAKTLPVSPNARPQVRDLKTGDMVRVPSTAAAEMQSVELRSVRVSARRRAFVLVGACGVVIGILMLLRASPKRLVLGEDGRYSKSKFQVALWFIALISGYLGTLVLRWWASNWTIVGGIGIPTDLVVISGMSAFTFVGAKSVTMQKMAQSAAFAAAKQVRVPAHFPDDLVNDDHGNPDLGDAQMVVITLIVVATYLTALFSWWGVLVLAAHVEMPNIDSTLVAVFGLGQGAYLVKKQIGS